MNDFIIIIPALAVIVIVFTIVFGALNRDRAREIKAIKDRVDDDFKHLQMVTRKLNLLAKELGFDSYYDFPHSERGSFPSNQNPNSIVAKLREFESGFASDCIKDIPAIMEYLKIHRVTLPEKPEKMIMCPDEEERSFINPKKKPTHGNFR